MRRKLPSPLLGSSAIRRLFYQANQQTKLRQLAKSTRSLMVQNAVAPINDA